MDFHADILATPLVLGQDPLIPPALLQTEIHAVRPLYSRRQQPYSQPSSLIMLFTQSSAVAVKPSKSSRRNQTGSS